MLAWLGLQLQLHAWASSNWKQLLPLCKEQVAPLGLEPWSLEYNPSALTINLHEEERT